MILIIGILLKAIRIKIELIEYNDFIRCQTCANSMSLNSCKIIMYHYVRPLKQSKYPEIKGLELEGFLRQIEYLNNNFNFITAERLLDCIYKKIGVPEKAVLL